MLITSSWPLDLTILLGTLLSLLYWYTSRAQQYWQKRGVYTPKALPIIGHFLDVAIFRKNLAEWMKHFYDLSDEKYFGLYIFDEPLLILKDPELIKQVVVKDFHHFQDRSIGVPKHDEVQSNLMFLQKSPAWKMMRTKMTPAFTSGRLKAMMHLVNDSAEEMVKFLSKREGIYEAKEISAKYATNVIARCAFGIDSECFLHEKAVFREVGRRFFDNSWRNAFSQTIYFMKPSWIDTLGLDFIHDSCIRYFTDVFLGTMENRSDQERYNDLIDIIKDLKKNNDFMSQELDDAKIAGVAIQFFMAGFETTSSTISFTLHELCLKKHIQDRVRKEIKDVINKFGGISYESVKEMHYLDMCINETLRRYPVLPFLDRRCNEDYKVPGSNLVIEKGTPVYIPMYGLHMDEKYYPNPYEYNPERFNKKFNNDNGLVFLPFGEGPRNCIGERFGRLSTKLCLIHIIKNFEVIKCKGSPDPVVLDPKCFLFTALGGLPMQFKPLNGKSI